MALLLPSRLQQALNFSGAVVTRRASRFRCSAIAVDASSRLAGGVSGIRWGSSTLQGPRSEMEDVVVLRSDGLSGFTFATVFDGHAGISSVEFLRDELYKECMNELRGGLLLGSKDFHAIKDALTNAFENADGRLLTWLEQIQNEDESGATATVMFVGNDVLIISHVGDSCVVLSRKGKAEVLTSPHRPFGSNKVSMEEARRIRAAGGWIVDGRICGDLSVSRAFGDLRFKTKKNEMLLKGVEEGKWTEKFISRINFKDDLVTPTPDITHIYLGSDVEFILLASDGLWDYIKSSDAVNFVRNHLRQHGDVQLACEALAQAALDRRSQDNISVVIADLRTDWQNLPDQRPNMFFEAGQAFVTVGIVSLGIWVAYFLFL
ncbi:probable protein phosphatase 2C 5 isoform X1 [Dendrobium catenatum]|uniref:probable protein phosphatase 2C 5 isoform X1 n=1 Tax=Dendrobium catenatum TaxID=906689 RepID=UPI0009F3C78D|nr:probable protein phosphatase 2C 5 isoform X1 [Dendrobium catenatum]